MIENDPRPGERRRSPAATTRTVLAVALAMLPAGNAWAQDIEFLDGGPGCSNRGSAGPATAGQPWGDRLARDLPGILLESGVPGASVAVVEGDEVAWCEGFGARNAETVEPVEPSTLFEAASLSKPVFAYVVLRLADRGVIDLDRPLAEYLSYERLEHDPRHRRITPRMVLSHQTGLPNWGGDPLELQADPGTFGYSGEGFVYLQRVVERVTGEDLQALARREAFEPLGLTSTSYVWLDVFEGRAASGHDRIGGAVPLQRFDEPNAAFSLVTTAEDYARFLAAMMQGEGLKAETAEALRTGWIDAAGWSLPEEGAGKVSWGLGIGIQEGRAGKALWHWGQRPRFTAYAIGYPERRRALVVFLNAGHGLSTAEAIVSRFEPDDEHWALRFLGYEPYDAPEQAALQRLLSAFTDGGAEAGVEAFENLLAERPRVAEEDLVGDVGGQLLDAGRDAEAAALYAAYVEAFPASATGHGWLGEARMWTGDHALAVESYRRALAIDPGDEEHARELAWIEPLAADHAPVDVPLATLERYAGDYGPRHVWMEDGQLHYRRDGGPEFRLVPFSTDTFTLEGLPTFRIRFVDGDGDGIPEKIEGRYFDGRVDAAERSFRLK